jgi:hypothetical protein
MMCSVGALVTLDLPAGSPALDLPWIITIGPLTDEEGWDAVVVGPYERAHAIALAEEAVADDQLMAVVEPILPLVSLDSIREEIAIARAAAVELADDEDDDDADSDIEYVAYATGEAHQEGEAYQESEEHQEREGKELTVHPDPPTPDEVRAGVARVAARLLAENLAEPENVAEPGENLPDTENLSNTEDRTDPEDRAEPENVSGG